MRASEWEALSAIVTLVALLAYVYVEWDKFQALRDRVLDAAVVVAASIGRAFIGGVGAGSVMGILISFIVTVDGQGTSAALSAFLVGFATFVLPGTIGGLMGDVERGSLLGGVAGGALGVLLFVVEWLVIPPRPGEAPLINSGWEGAALLGMITLFAGLWGWCGGAVGGFFAETVQYGWASKRTRL